MSLKALGNRGMDHLGQRLLAQLRGERREDDEQRVDGVVLLVVRAVAAIGWPSWSRVARPPERREIFRSERALPTQWLLALRELPLRLQP